MDQDHPVAKKPRLSTQNTKKLGCPAAVKVSRRVIFRDFIVSNYLSPMVHVHCIYTLTYYLS